MNIQDMLTKITEIEKRRNVVIYINYDTTIGWKFSMYGGSGSAKVGLTRTIPPNQIAIWDIVILEGFLESMADGIEIGVTN